MKLIVALENLTFPDFEGREPTKKEREGTVKVVGVLGAGGNFEQFIVVQGIKRVKSVIKLAMTAFLTVELVEIRAKCILEQVQEAKQLEIDHA